MTFFQNTSVEHDGENTGTTSFDNVVESRHPKYKVPRSTNENITRYDTPNTNLYSSKRRASLGEARRKLSYGDFAKKISSENASTPKSLSNSSMTKSFSLFLPNGKQSNYSPVIHDTPVASNIGNH